MKEPLKFKIAALRVENGEHFAPANIIARCSNKADADMIVDALNNSDWNALFQFGVVNDYGDEPFEDYADENGDVHVDARQTRKSDSQTLNFRAGINEITHVGDRQPHPSPKLVIHHCDLVGDGAPCDTLDDILDYDD